MGIHTVNSLDGCKEGICIIRSHGMPCSKIEEIKNKGFEIVDLTCPDVKKVQEKACGLALESYPLIILGREEHPEVSAIKADALMHSSKVFVVPDITGLDKISDFIRQEEKAGVVIQTTQKAEFLQEAVSKLLLITKELKVFNTICRSTELRQKEAEELAKVSDLMIVIGGRNSENTARLAEIASKITKTIKIETADELDAAKDIIKNAENIGITAGASTPEYLVSEITEKIKNI